MEKNDFVRMNSVFNSETGFEICISCPICLFMRSYIDAGGAIMLEGPRAVREEELSAVVDLADSVFYPNHTGDMRGWFPTFFSLKNLPNLRVITDDRTPISIAGYTIREIAVLGARIRCASIGSVCTLPLHQGKGLASLLMEDVLRGALEQDAVLLLVSGKRELYHRMGCSDAGQYAAVSIPRDAALPDFECEISEWRREDISEMVMLQQAEPVRFIRAAEEMRTLLETRALYCKPARTWVVKAGDCVLSYACVQDPVDESGRKVLKIREIAGSRFALLAAVPKLFDRYGTDRIDVDILGMDGEMRSMASTFKLPVEPHGFHGTVKVIDTRGLFAAIDGFIHDRLEAEEKDKLSVGHDGGVLFRFEKESFRLSTGPDISAFLFGSVERKPLIPESPALNKILGKLFPLPLVDYGLNYI
jgi:predicted N-acetyltransferase YhbS